MPLARANAAPTPAPAATSARGLSLYARDLMLDGARLRRELDVPVLLWEAPSVPGPRVLGTAVAGTCHLPRAGEPLVLPLRKGAHRDNAFSMGITVGRTQNNDVWLDDPSVSRFHAWLQPHARGEGWELVDAESRNGTRVDALRLSPSSAHLLPDGSRLRFGDVEVRFLLPSTFLSQLEQHLRP